MTPAHKSGKALINVLFQLAVRKIIHQRSADICTRKKASNKLWIFNPEKKDLIMMSSPKAKARKTLTEREE